MNATKRAAVGAMVLGSVLLSGCVYSRREGGPNAWGVSVGLCTLKSECPAAGGQVEIPLARGDSDQHIVLGGGGIIGNDDPWDDDDEERSWHKEDFRFCYRRYFGPGRPADAILRPFLEVGISGGTTVDCRRDGMGVTFEVGERKHLTAGFGLKWRLLAVDWLAGANEFNGPRNVFYDISVNHLSDVGAYGMINCGWSFGQPTRNASGLGFGGGLRSAGPRMGLVYVTGEAADQLNPMLSVMV